jgi:hypothetical protein
MSPRENSNTLLREIIDLRSTSIVLIDNPAYYDAGKHLCKHRRKKQ